MCARQPPQAPPPALRPWRAGDHLGLGFHRAYCPTTLVEPTGRRSPTTCPTAWRPSPGPLRAPVRARRRRPEPGSTCTTSRSAATPAPCRTCRSGTAPSTPCTHSEWDDVENLLREGEPLGVQPEPWTTLVDPAHAASPAGTSRPRSPRGARVRAGPGGDRPPPAHVRHRRRHAVRDRRRCTATCRPTRRCTCPARRSTSSTGATTGASTGTDPASRAGRGEPAIGEATPTYMYEPVAVERMAPSSPCPTGGDAAQPRRPGLLALLDGARRGRTFEEAMEDELAGEDRSRRSRRPTVTTVTTAMAMAGETKSRWRWRGAQAVTTRTTSAGVGTSRSWSGWRRRSDGRRCTSPCSRTCGSPARTYAEVCRFLGVDDGFRPPDLGRAVNRFVGSGPCGSGRCGGRCPRRSHRPRRRPPQCAPRALPTARSSTPCAPGRALRRSAEHSLPTWVATFPSGPRDRGERPLTSSPRWRKVHKRRADQARSTIAS